MKFLKSAELGLLLFILCYVAGVYAVMAGTGHGEQFSLLLYSKPVMQVTVMLFLFFVGWRVYSLILFQRPRHLTLTLVQDIKSRLFRRDQLAAAFPVFIAFMFFMAAFTAMKGMIPVLQPYHWDARFAALDRFLHFGNDPWLLLQPLLGHAWITAGLNILYNLWFVVMFAVLYWQLFDLRNRTLRLRFFWTFFLTWIVNGSVLAVVLSSAGPCYFGFVEQDIVNPFAAQMDYLRALSADYPVWAVQTQDRLWGLYQDNTNGVGSGISAMPSVHVAIVTLFALLSRSYGRLAQWFFIGFAIVIMIGSVHLAWHYAVDGYLGALVTGLLWMATGLVFGKGKAHENLD